MERVIGNPFDVELTGLSFEELDQLLLAIAAIVDAVTSIECAIPDNGAARAMAVNLFGGATDLIERVYKRMAALDLSDEQRSLIETSISNMNFDFAQNFIDWDVNTSTAH